MRRPAILGGPPLCPDGLAFARPVVPPLERVVARLAPSYDAGILTNGPLVRQLEEEAADYLGVADAVGVGSCTSGLMLALRALKPEGRAVLPGFTFSATAHAAAWNGLVPEFADCDARTFQLDPQDAARRLAGAGVLMATHVFGAPCAVDELEALARRHRIPLVFDAAHAFGAVRRGTAVGGAGDVEVFSLSPTKIVVAGEGGLVTTNRQDVATAVRHGRDYGNPGDYDTRFVGLNARMSELHAAVALESMAMLDEHLARRRAIAAGYGSELAGLSGLRLQAVDQGDVSTWKDVTVTVDEERFGLPRDLVVAGLRAEGIDVRCYFSPPVNRQQSYAHLRPPCLPVTERVAAQVVSLPVRVDLGEACVDLVTEALGGLQSHADEVGGRSLVGGPGGLGAQTGPAASSQL